MRLLPLFYAHGALDEKKRLFSPRLEVGGLSSSISDVVIEHPRLCERMIYLDIIMALEIVWPHACTNYLPFSNCSISWVRGSVGSQVPIILTAFFLRSILSIAPQLEVRCCSMVSDVTCTNTVNWYTSSYRKTGSTPMTICFFKALSMAVYFRNSAWFCWNLSDPSACYWALPIICGQLTGLCGGKNVKLVYSMCSSAVIVSTRCPCRPPLRFDATDAAFLLINHCISISPSLVGSLFIFISMGVRKSARSPSPVLVAPAVQSLSLVGLDGRFVPWDNLSKLLKDISRLTRRLCSVELKVDYIILCLLQVGIVKPRLVWLTVLATCSKFHFYQILDSRKGIIQFLGNWIPDSLKGIIRCLGYPGIVSSSNTIQLYPDRAFHIGLKKGAGYIGCFNFVVSHCVNEAWQHQDLLGYCGVDCLFFFIYHLCLCPLQKPLPLMPPSNFSWTNIRYPSEARRYSFLSFFVRLDQLRPL